MLTTEGPDISLSSLLKDASSLVHIAPDPWFHVTFLSKYLKRLWTKHHYSDTAPFHCICSENPCFIQELMIALNEIVAEVMPSIQKNISDELDKNILQYVYFEDYYPGENSETAPAMKNLIRAINEKCGPQFFQKADKIAGKDGENVEAILAELEK